MMGGASWTDERCDKLRLLWTEGLSCSQIAAALGDGISRNGVIGKVHRLGLSGPRKKASPRAKPARPIQRNRMTRYVAPPRSSAQREEDAAIEMEEVQMNTAADADIPVSRRKTLLDLNADDCRWPVGDPGDADFFFCGAIAAPDKPYCQEHCARAYTGAVRITESQRLARRRNATKTALRPINPFEEDAA